MEFRLSVPEPRFLTPFSKKTLAWLAGGLSGRPAGRGEQSVGSGANNPLARGEQSVWDMTNHTSRLPKLLRPPQIRIIGRKRFTLSALSLGEVFQRRGERLGEQITTTNNNKHTKQNKILNISYSFVYRGGGEPTVNSFVYRGVVESLQ